jgi:hypothetical protein
MAFLRPRIEGLRASGWRDKGRDGAKRRPISAHSARIMMTTVLAWHEASVETGIKSDTGFLGYQKQLGNERKKSTS